MKWAFWYCVLQHIMQRLKKCDREEEYKLDRVKLAEQRMKEFMVMKKLL